MIKWIILMMLAFVAFGCGPIGVVATVDGEVTIVHTVEAEAIQDILEMACGANLQCQRDLLTSILEGIGNGPL